MHLRNIATGLFMCATLALVAAASADHVVRGSETAGVSLASPAASDRMNW